MKFDCRSYELVPEARNFKSPPLFGTPEEINDTAKDCVLVLDNTP